ncbi:CapA family protein [Umezawaea endophytica]|uniref:CapA family protein n=1 Tax=Umezawaea endophytica TaxID=1654476 RepID=A0A9X2VMC2_9PSEU|nr:CapA family protein [Umezawaea endophytica]MCS7477818.1 CapA family protein [Umezawaea endophytica]
MGSPVRDRGITIAAAGSAMFQTRLRTVQDPGLHSLFDVLRSADVGLLNLEAPIRDVDAHPVKQVYTSYVTSEPWVTEELTWGGVNMVSLANNHMSDWSASSIATNQRLLDEAGIAWAGAGRTLAAARAPGYLDTPQGRVGLIAVDSSYEYGQYYQVQMGADPHGDVPGRPGTSGLRWDTTYVLDPERFDRLREAHRALGLHREGMEITHLAERRPTPDSFLFRGVTILRGRTPGVRTACRPVDLDQVVRWIRGTRSQVDYLVVSHHNHQAAGTEWELPADFTREFAHAAVDAGADVYIGHGYTPKGVELYRGKVICYDIGDWSTQDAAARWHPADAYERWGLDPGATPGDFATARERARAEARDAFAGTEFGDQVKAYSAAVGQSAVVRITFDEDRVSGVELHPSLPRADARRHLRNLPTRAVGEAAERVVGRFAAASAPLGTKIDHRDGVGHVVLH